MKLSSGIIVLLLQLSLCVPLEASSREEQCSMCAGLNSTCHLISGIFTRRGLAYGYNKVATIPQGACSINVTEMFATRNYIALRLTYGSYLLNGDWQLARSGQYTGAGTTFHYHRTPQDRLINGKERLFSMGPTNDSVDIMLLRQHTNLGIMYEYIVPMEKKSGSMAIENVQANKAQRSNPLPLQTVHDEASAPREEPSPHVVPQADQPQDKVSSDQHNHRTYQGSQDNKRFQYQVVGGTSNKRGFNTHSSTGDPAGLSGDRPYRADRGLIPKEYHSGRRPFYQLSPSSDVYMPLQRQTDHELPYNRVTGHRLRHQGRHGRSQRSNQGLDWSYTSLTQQRAQQHYPTSSQAIVGPNTNSVAQQYESLHYQAGTPSNAAYPSAGNPERNPSPPAQPRPHVYSGSTYIQHAAGSVSHRGWHNQRAAGPGPLNDQIALSFPESRTHQISNLDSGSDYSWRISGFTECTLTCGGGVQTTIVVCVKGGTLAVVTDDNCDNALKPQLQTVTCNSNPCPPMWVEEPWTNCSVPCGGGTQTRVVTCQQQVSQLITLTLPPTSCRQQQPQSVRTCNQDVPCVRWHIGHWGKCSVQCGKGVRNRQVSCLNIHNDTVAENKCSPVRPVASEVCDRGSCAEAWFYTNWSDQCFTNCGEGNYTRRIFCSADEERCRSLRAPATTKPCEHSVACRGQWFAGHWAQCSVSCGRGTQERSVVCIKEVARLPTVVADDNCDAALRPHSQKPCEQLACTPRWYTTDWSQCSQPCNSGQRQREVKCLDGSQQPSEACQLNEKPTRWQACSTHPCSTPQEDNGCVDKFKNCRLVAQARLCLYSYYSSSCCQSCRKP